VANSKKKKRATSHPPAPSADQKFLDAIYADPASDDARLVYADVLLERGDPRGEMIQIQCEIARINEDDERWHRIRHRERTLLRENEPEWSKELLALGNFFFRFHRGFVEEVGGMGGRIVQHAEKILQHAPLIWRFGVNVHTPEELPALIESPLYSKIVEISIGAARSRVHLEPFMKAPPSNIRSLQFSEVALGEEDIRTIAKDAVAFFNLRDLGFELTRFGQEALAPLSTMHKAPLERFKLMTSHSSDLLIKGIVSGASFKNLKALIITNNQIGDAGLAEIMAAHRLHMVEELDLRSNKLSFDAVMSLLDPKNPIGPLRKLWLASNDGVNDDFVEQLLKWKGAARLEKLDLGGGSKITTKGLMMIAKSPVLTNLRSLVVSDVKVNEATKKALLESPALAKSRLYVDSQFLARH
jgi:uncharacterized protein (TIGR02996 family)